MPPDLLVPPPRCPTCSRPLDDRGRCWKCCNRLCPCGRLTGSAFIAVCLLCEREDKIQVRKPSAPGDPADVNAV
jgi:hypothetical protein